MGCCIMRQVEEHEQGFEILVRSGKVNGLEIDECSGSIVVFDSKDLKKTLVWGI